MLGRLKRLTCPVFYLKHDLSPKVPTWGDAIGRLIKFFRGRDYTYGRPVDMWFAIQDMLSHIRSRHTTPAVPSETEPVSKNQ
jgi:hypothetical protein